MNLPNNVQWARRSVAELIAIFAMLVVVLVLAMLQYRWTGEISRTEQARLKVSLATSVRNFDQEFSYDFQQLCESFEIDPETQTAPVENRVLHQYSNWKRTTSRPGIIVGVYIWKTGNARGSDLESLDRDREHFEKISWPSRLESLRQLLERQLGQLSSVGGDREAIYYPWTFYENSPALIRPLFQISSSGRESTATVQPIGFLVVELNGEYLYREYLPELVDRHFGSPGLRSFNVAVRTAKAPYRAIYVSDANFPIATSSPDSEVNLFELVGEEAKRRGHPPLQASDQARQWQLVVQHPTGSLDIAVTSWRRRNFGISLGLLSILAGSVVLIFSVARRSRILAKQQMEFVAGVSHELCTPLAVINSAAENLADGIVENTQQVQEYGDLIRGQGRRLERIVDEVLLFTAGRFGLSGYELRPVEVASIIAQSLAVSEPLLRDAGFTVEKEIRADLPLVLADPSAIITCVENLVSNTMKYAGANRWIAVRAHTVSADSMTELQISVEDRGIGIPSDDLPNIFEPFYRVQAVRDSQIRGVGLGLYLVKRMMGDMGGRVTVSSKLGRGTVVILHFPVAEITEHQQDDVIPHERIKW